MFISVDRWHRIIDQTCGLNSIDNVTIRAIALSVLCSDLLVCARPQSSPNGEDSDEARNW
jgi:hypothetical protein